jgi:ATP-dependent helicase/DNAse subunit B
MKIRTNPKPKVEAPTVSTSKSPYEKGMWNLYRDGLTQSMLNVFLSCPEKMRLSYCQGLESTKAATSAMEFGNLVHDLLDMVYSGFRDTANQQDFVENLQPHLTLAINDYHDEKSEELLAEGSDTMALELNTALADLVLPTYFQTWKEDWATFEWVALEEVFDEVLTVEYNGQMHSIRIRGKFDGIVRINGKLWLFETKTKGRIEEDNIVDKLSLDLQVFLYFWAMKQRYGEYPAGVIYNIIRKPQQRRKSDEDIKAFASRVGIEVRKDPSHYFVRINGTVTKSELNEWEQEFHQIIRQVIQWFEGGFHYKNTTHCMGSFTPCTFLGLCGGGRHEFYRPRKKLFKELDMVPFKMRQ